MEYRNSVVRQPRSNSIGGQEFHHIGPDFYEQHSRQPNHGLLVDSNNYYDIKSRDYNSNLYNGRFTNVRRTVSPPNLNGRPTDFCVPKRSSSIKYQHENKQTLARSHIHTSLECLNNIYSEYGQQNQKQPSNILARQYHHPHYQQKHQSVQHNTYAATYVLTAPPTDIVISQNPEQDLAAAAMVTPQQYDRAPASSGNIGQMSRHNLSHYHAQGAFNNRTPVSMSQSPMHRRLVHGPMANILNQITSSTTSTLRAGHSSLSLASSTYLIEEKLQNEIKQLQSELKSEKEKNEALNGQLNINSNLMAAFEQSLTTLNNRLRQMTTLNERKDKEIDQLSAQLRKSNCLTVETTRETSEKSTSPICAKQDDNLSRDQIVLDEYQRGTELISQDEQAHEQVFSRGNQTDKQSLLKVIEDLKRQLIEKDRLLTDTRLEALSTAHQLEQLESRLNGEQSIVINEEELDEGVMVANHSPSDSDAITDSLHLNDHKSGSANSRSNHNNRTQQSSQAFEDESTDDMILFTPTHRRNTSSERRAGVLTNGSNYSNGDTNEMIHVNRRQHDNQSDHSSSDFHDDDASPGDTIAGLEYNTSDKTPERPIHV